MADYNNAAPGKGAVFPNNYHKEGDNKPHYTGHLFAHRDLRAGERIELALWPHKTGGGMSIKAQDPRVPSGGTLVQTPGGYETKDPPGDGGSIPF